MKYKKGKYKTVTNMSHFRVVVPLSNHIPRRPQPNTATIQLTK